ncbi:hypothetical protein [Mucilaginibacter aquariorum]|uniref:GLPGLI family protein n=1 Tax=Mucilaginibacter aquariorum TaxID=2967225 RepID=A0ABT1T2H9_9SPHI|nr:hypothetical protein [Mucilaginibacter aquariorum]MCQ6958810.1 hypothetical protein [Mucilaginibacter aquariorum]
MKVLYAIVIFCSLASFKTAAQDTVACKDLPAYLGRKITLQMRAVDFDMRKENIYLYYGNRYPEQEFTVIIKRNNGKKRIKLNKNIIVGRATAPLIGYITTYDGEPDTTKNYDDAAVKREFEKGIPAEIIAIKAPIIFSMKYRPRTAPIDLKGKLVMFITEQWQIGATHQLPPLRLISPPTMSDNMDF